MLRRLFGQEDRMQYGQLRRREFIVALTGAAAVWPLAARGQQPAIPVVGFLSTASPDEFTSFVAGFRDGLKRAGYVEGENVAIEYRWAEGDYNRLPALAIDLVRRQVKVIAAIDGLPSILAAKAATTTIPIVFFTGADPVKYGLVASFNRPGGNITGLVTLNAALVPKRLELIHEVMPTVRTIALLVNPANPVAEGLVAEALAAARRLGAEVRTLHASAEQDFDRVFAGLRAGALVIGPDPFFNSRNEQLAALALRHLVASVFQYREFTASGGLMAYGTDLRDAWGQAGIMTGRILKGDKPAELPVQQVTKVELIINLKTAKTLGINVPLTLVGGADEIIE
jgi:putative tryptophan/tyrosine transport system substrate-binding protein